MIYIYVTMHCIIEPSYIYNFTSDIIVIVERFDQHKLIHKAH